MIPAKIPHDTRVDYQQKIQETKEAITKSEQNIVGMLREAVVIDETSTAALRTQSETIASIHHDLGHVEEHLSYSRRLVRNLSRFCGCLSAIPDAPVEQAATKVQSVPESSAKYAPVPKLSAGPRDNYDEMSDLLDELAAGARTKKVILEEQSKAIDRMAPRVEDAVAGTKDLSKRVKKIN